MNLKRRRASVAVLLRSKPPVPIDVGVMPHYLQRRDLSIDLQRTWMSHGCADAQQLQSACRVTYTSGAVTSHPSPFLKHTHTRSDHTATAIHSVKCRRDTKPDSEINPDRTVQPAKQSPENTVSPELAQTASAIPPLITQRCPYRAVAGGTHHVVSCIVNAERPEGVVRAVIDPNVVRLFLGGCDALDRVVLD